MDNLDKIHDRVRKLLAYAENRRDHEDAQAYYDRAFELMARYGVSERDLADQDSEITREEFTLGGAYTDMQDLLLTTMAHALECMCLSWGVERSTRRPRTTVFGPRPSLDRLRMLFTILNPTMLARAYDDSFTMGHPGTSLTVRRRSYMRGFAYIIGERLTAAETKVVAEGGSTLSLALVDERTRTRQALEDYLIEHKLTTKTRAGTYQHDPLAMSSGAQSAQNLDIGQTRMQNRRALSPG